jgi:hypothetical protein
MARKRRSRHRMVYSWTYGFHDGAVVGVFPDRKPTEKKLKDDGLKIDEDGVFRESFYDPTYWHKWEPEKRTKLGEVLANRMNTRRALRELVLPELNAMQESIDSLREQLDRVEKLLAKRDT